MERWNKTDLQGYVVLGSNGEFPYLDEDEKVNLIGLVRKHMAVDKVLIAGTGDGVHQADHPDDEEGG